MLTPHCFCSNATRTRLGMMEGKRKWHFRFTMLLIVRCFVFLTVRIASRIIDRDARQTRKRPFYVVLFQVTGTSHPRRLGGRWWRFSTPSWASPWCLSVCRTSATSWPRRFVSFIGGCAATCAPRSPKRWDATSQLGLQSL